MRNSTIFLWEIFETFDVVSMVYVFDDYKINYITKMNKILFLY